MHYIISFMINRDELIMTVDENNQVLKPRSRREVHANTTLWCRASNICIINSKRQVLCQQRGKMLDISPNQWSVVFGGVSSIGDEPINTALRELAEETGLKAKPTDLTYFKSFKDVGKRRYRSLYVLVRDVSLSELKLEEEEVAAAKWFSLKELRKKISISDPAWSWRGYELQLLSFAERLI